MYRKNTAGQFLYFCLVNATNGTALTGATVTAYRALGNGSQASATGTTTELANGQYRFDLSQADTNADYGSYLFTATNAVPVEKTVVFTAANPTDAAAFGLSKFGDIETDTQNIQSRIPAALVSGRMDASVGAMAANTITAAALAADAVVEIQNEILAQLYDDISNNNAVWGATFWDSMQVSVATLDRLLPMLEQDGLVYRFTANALEQAPATSASAIRSAVGLASANLDTQLGAIDDYLDTEVAAIKAKTDLITSTTNFITVERVAGSTITMYYNEATTATVGLDENTSSLTLRFVVENSDQLDVLVIENANITRTASNCTVTITTAVTATLGQYRWALRDITGGINRLIEGGVLQVVSAANKDA